MKIKADITIPAARAYKWAVTPAGTVRYEIRLNPVARAQDRHAQITRATNNMARQFPMATEWGVEVING